MHEPIRLISLFIVVHFIKAINTKILKLHEANQWFDSFDPQWSRQAVGTYPFWDCTYVGIENGRESPPIVLFGCDWSPEEIIRLINHKMIYDSLNRKICDLREPG